MSLSHVPGTIEASSSHFHPPFAESLELDMDAKIEYLSSPLPERKSVDSNSCEDWHQSLALWDSHCALGSPIASVPDTTTPTMHHPNTQNFMFTRESPVSMFSSSTFSDESLAMHSYVDNMSPMLPYEELHQRPNDALSPYHHLDYRSHLAHHISSPVLLGGYPIPTPGATPTQSSAGLGIALPSSSTSSAPYQPSLSPRWQNQSSNHNPHHSSNLPPHHSHIHTQIPNQIPKAAPNPTQQGSKRSSTHMSDVTPLPDAKKRTSPSKARHRRSVTDIDPAASRTAKLAHNIVERNYRDRLNDQIAELSSYLFDFSNENKARSRPPKSLVISRAKERLMELTSHNEELMTQVAQLKQQIAVLDHIVGAGAARPL